MTLNISRQKSDLVLLGSLFLIELSVAIVLMALYMKGDRSFVVFLSSRPGVVMLMAVAVIAAAGAVIAQQFLANRRSPSVHFPLVVTMNLVTVILILVSGEIAIRAASHSSPEGERVGGAVLRPKSWDSVARHYRQVIDRAAGDLSYLVYDDLMGWTVGPNRRSANGLYRSSSEGIRAPVEGVSFPGLSEKSHLAVNASILKAFMRSTLEAGAIPLIIYFPNKVELEKGASPRMTKGKRVLEEAGVAYTDLTPCLLKTAADDRFGQASRHYFASRQRSICPLSACSRERGTRASLVSFSQHSVTFESLSLSLVSRPCQSHYRVQDAL